MSITIDKYFCFLEPVQLIPPEIYNYWQLVFKQA